MNPDSPDSPLRPHDDVVPGDRPMPGQSTTNQSAMLALAVFFGFVLGVGMTTAFVYFDPFGVLRPEQDGATRDRRPYLANRDLADPDHAAAGASAVDDHAGHDHGPGGSGGESGLPAEASRWTCSMHPEVLEDGPGSCPICNMALTEITPSAISDVPGAVRLDPEAVRRLNVRTASASRRDIDRVIRTVGNLEFDQQRMVTVTTKYQGWIEKVHVANVGAPVRHGQPLFEIYSPELVQTQQELLSARTFAERMDDAPEDARRRAHSLVDAARTRLAYWDISPELIRQLEATGEPFRTVEITAPRSGLVMRITPGLEGMAVVPGTETFHIADLSTLWLSVDIFEDQMALVRPGTAATVTFSAFPGETFRGEVRYLDPELSEATRTLRAKISVPNAQGKLRAGMFATVVLTSTAAADTVVVPRESVLRTGTRDLVIVESEPGLYVPREVTIGAEDHEWSQVLAGLDDGEQVVTSAQFLLDSESNLRAAIARLTPQRPSNAGTRGEDAEMAGHAGHHH